MYFIQWINLWHIHCKWTYEHMSLVSCHTSALISTDTLHFIILYFIVLILMYCNLSFCHLYFANDFDMTCKL
jgi:hypothetical protein